MKKAVLFDLDGTLANTLPDLAFATNHALEENGFDPCPLDAYPHMVGNGARVLVERALGQKMTPANTELVLASFLQIYDQTCLDQVCLYPGIDDAIRLLKANGFRLLVVTNKPQAQAEKIIRHFFGETLMEGIYGGRPDRPKKPDPTAVHMALTAVHVLPENAWFVGDSDVDVQTAKAAGMRCVGAAWGFRGEKELRQAGADYVASSPQDMLQHILREQRGSKEE